MTSDNVNWKNVNNWHWMEKDCTTWAHDRLRHHLSSVSFKNYKVDNIKNIDGEVSVNVRKGKIRQIFDLTINLEIIEEGKDEKIETKIIDFMSDTDNKSFEFGMIKVNSEIKEGFKQRIWDILMKFKEEVVEVQGKTLLIESGVDTSSETTSISSKESTKEKINFTEVIPNESKQSKSTSSNSTSSIEDTVAINAPLTEVWESLTNPIRISAWTRGTSQINNFESGSSFSLFNGNIIGKVTELKQKESIKLDWKLKHWDTSCISKVILNFNEEGNHRTIIKMQQKNIPISEASAVKENWNRYYWEPIRNLLGCSTSIY